MRKVPVYCEAPFSYGAGHLVLLGSCEWDGLQRLVDVRHGDAAGEVRQSLIVSIHTDTSRLPGWKSVLAHGA